MNLFDYGLSSQQLEVIDALSSGATSTAAAAQVGVHRNTIANWRRNNLIFRGALAHAQYDRALLAREQYESRLEAALRTIDQILADPKAPASVRLKAAQAIIDKATTPPPPQTELLFQLKDVEVPFPVHNNAQPEPVPSEAAQNDEKPHKNAQSTPAAPQTIRREGPKTGRNDPCPCGSGKKYKRCCLNKPSDQPLAAAA